MLMEFSNEKDIYIPHDISEIERIIKKGADTFDFKNTPIKGFNEKKISMEYLLLHQPAMSESPITVKDYFEITEGQASWIVLREFFSDEEIANYENQKRQSLFVKKLYENSGKFVFFENREKALENLDALEIINQEDYKPYAARTLL